METDNETKVHELKALVKDFCVERDWDQFHDAKEMAIAISIEAGELLELFRFESREEVNHRFTIPKKREEIEDELSDCLFPILRLAQMYNIDLTKALKRKIGKNVEKYPVEKARGSKLKYNEF